MAVYKGESGTYKNMFLSWLNQHI